MDIPAPSTDMLLEIIRTQTDIARLGLDLGGVMTLVAERAQKMTGADGAAIELAEDSKMVYRAATGIASSQLGLRIPREGSLSGLCVESGEILSCEDSQGDPRVNQEACRRVGLRAMVAVPLKHVDTTVGVLKVMASAPAAFTETDQRALALLSDLVGAAMFHAGKYGTKELHLKATHDAMTGLANRALFYDQLHQALELAKSKKTKAGIFTIEVEGLRRITEVYGPRVGDAVIKELASRLKVAAQRLDCVARIGADQFAAILPDVIGTAAARAKLLRVQEQIKLPFRFGDLPLKLDACVGLAIFPDDGVSATILVERADHDADLMKQARQESLVQIS